MGFKPGEDFIFRSNFIWTRN